MQKPFNSQNPSQMPWWHREKKDGLSSRISQIQRVNDPTTYTDEVLTGAKFFIVLLLGFSGVLGALSYFQNFSISFPIEIAVFLALTLTIVIEWGKNKAATWAVRIPFFQGWSYLGQSPANTFIFVGLVCVALATFTMSIYNSTKGGEQLARMLSHEKNATVFAPDTKAIDDQIAATQQNVSAAPLVKWKGKQYYQDAKAVRAQSKSLESLQRQREEATKMQRADYERNLAIQASQTNFASKLVLASGGWIELLQVLLILLRVACEKNLDGRTSPLSRQKTQSADASSRQIGFNVGADGMVPTSDVRKPVSQSQQSVSQTNGTPPVMSAEEALRWFETELRREPSNLTNRHAQSDTVVNRIHGKLSRAENYLEAVEDASIPEKPAQRFKDYLQNDLFPVLNEFKPYPKSTRIIALIQSKSAGHAT